MRSHVFGLAVSIVVMGCGSGAPAEPPTDFLDAPLAASSSGATSSCYRFRQLLVAQRAIGYTFQWRQLDEDTWERTDFLPSTSTFEGPQPTYRLVYRRTGDLVYLIEGATIVSTPSTPVDVAAWTETAVKLPARNPDITPIPGCAR